MSWSFRFRASGRLARATIGQYPTISLQAARGRADAMRQEVAAGGNPALRKRQDRTGASSKTFGALAARYLVEHAQRRKRSHKADERNLRKHVLPRWERRPYTEIKRAEVIELVEAIVLAGKPTLANRCQSLISSIFTFALDAELVDSNPCHRMKKRGVENVGQRVLSDDELRLFWSGIIERERSRLTGLGLRLALLTGARVSEVAGLARGELQNIGDGWKATWTVPGTRTKNKKDHVIPLSPLARSIVLELLEGIDPKAEFLFPTRARRSGPMRSNSFTQAMAYFSGKMDDRTAEAARTWRIDPPSPHDLRRTAATRLAELQIPKEIRDRCLNHIPSDVGSKHYNKYEFHDEKREALKRWAAALEAIISESGATVLQSRRAHA